jgi:4-amino-4-deoxy-L-arabinose transferase-like glycosyltransferase
MNAIMTRWATPLTLGLFAVSAVSGVALFFHFGQGAFHEMHEWLSMVLLPPFALHMARNWTPLANYIKRSALWAPLGLSLVAAGAFAAPGLLEGGGGGPTGAVRLVMHAPLADVAPLFKTTPEGLRAALAAKGYKVGDGDSLERLAEQAHASPFALFGALAAKP